MELDVKLYVQLKDNAITNVTDDTYVEHISSDITDFGDEVNLDLSFTFEHGKDYWMHDDDGPTAFEVSVCIINNLDKFHEMTREQFINFMEEFMKAKHRSKWDWD